MADTGKEGEWGSQAHSLFLSFLFTYTHTFCSGASFSLCWAWAHRDGQRERQREKERRKKHDEKEGERGAKRQMGAEMEKAKTLTLWSCLMRHLAWKKSKGRKRKRERERERERDTQRERAKEKKKKTRPKHTSKNRRRRRLRGRWRPRDVESRRQREKWVCKWIGGLADESSEGKREIFGWRENNIEMKLQIATFSSQDRWSNGCRESPWLWASIKIDLNEFRVAVWHCINTPWHVGRRRNGCEEIKHL